MSECARKALSTLLRKAEGAWTRNSSRAVTLVFSDGSFPDYLNLPNYAERERAHAELRNAARIGALRIEWDRHAGEDGQIVRLRLEDPDLLAQHIGVVPLWSMCEKAASALGLGLQSPPEVSAIYAAWCSGKSPRKLGPDRVADFVDALRVIAACKERGQGEDIALRRLSVELFRDTKRIEAITAALDVLTGGLNALPRVSEEVWAGLGLVKYPQPILCAGAASVQLRDGASLRLSPPYLGIPADAIRSVSLPDSCEFVLSVENLTTFNELARGRGGAIAGLIIYTGGMPSPSLLRVYRALINVLRQGAPVWHWGDIDVGGYRIAAALNAVTLEHGRAVQLFRMNPALITNTPDSGPLSDIDVREIARLARNNGWQEEARGVESVPRAYEQEAIAPRLPM